MELLNKKELNLKRFGKFSAHPYCKNWRSIYRIWVYVKVQQSDHLIRRLIWTWITDLNSHLNRSQVLFFKTRGNNPRAKEMQRSPGCHHLHRPRVQGPRGQNGFKGWGRFSGSDGPGCPCPGPQGQGPDKEPLHGQGHDTETRCGQHTTEPWGDVTIPVALEGKASGQGRWFSNLNV